MRGRMTPVSTPLGAALTAVWAWWAWKQGAYFGTVMLPGALVLSSVAAVVLLARPLALRLRGAPAVALAALAAIALLTGASLAWTATRDVAAVDAERVIVYAIAFFLGMTLCHVLGRRMQLASLPVAAAAGLVGVATVITIGTGHDLGAYLHADGTLRYPLGYRNANAAFFLIALWPALGLALEPNRDRRLRAVMFATAVLCVELAVLCQSRGSLLAIAVATGVFVALHPRQRASVAALGAVAIPVAASLPWLLDVYTAADGGSLLGTLHTAALTVAITTTLTLAAGLALAHANAQTPRFLDVPSRRPGRGALMGVAGMAVIAAAGAFALGDPVGRISDDLDEFTSGGYTTLPESTRFSANASSNRSDFWRVAVDEFRDSPVLGTGAGGFRYAYLRERHSAEAPEDPHSVEALMASELGLAGVALFSILAVSAAIGAMRPRRLGPQAAALSTVALAAGAYWLTQASLDWFWSYAGVTAPVVFLLGAASAPGLLDPGAGSASRARRIVAALLAVTALATVPLFLSDRYLQYGVAAAANDPNTAFTDFDRSESLNPFADDPLLAEGALAREQGDTERAAAAYRLAIGREPENWVPQYLLGTLLAPTDPTASRTALERARELNPDDPGAAMALGLAPP